MSKKAKYSKFYTIVEGSREQQKGYPYIISKEIKYSRFYSAVEDSRGQ